MHEYNSKYAKQCNLLTKRWSCNIHIHTHTLQNHAAIVIIYTQTFSINIDYTVQTLGTSAASLLPKVLCKYITPSAPSFFCFLRLKTSIFII